MKFDISIGVPVYNGEKYLERALKSLVNQTCQNFKILVSNNSSTDNTAKIISKFERLENIDVYVQAKNIGAVENFNFLLNNCSTKYFIWMGHDDFLSPNFIEVLQKEIEINQYDTSFLPKTKLTNANGDIISEKSRLHHSRTKKAFQSKSGISLSFSKYPVAYWFYAVWQTEHLKNTRAFRDKIWPQLKTEKYPAHGDVIQVLLLLLDGKIKYLPNISYYYHVSTVGSNKGKVGDFYRIYRSFFLFNAILKAAFSGSWKKQDFFKELILRFRIFANLTFKLVKPRHLIVRIILLPFKSILRLFLKNHNTTF